MLSLVTLVAISITIAIIVIQLRDIDQRLDDLEAVDTDLPSLCHLNPDPGPCSSKIERFS